MSAQLTWKKTLLWVAIFSTAMGYLECTVVVYLREIYYPGGFNFPLAPIDKPIAITEIGREAATLVMLLGIGFLAGRSNVQRFAYFIYSFAIWDIFYYVFLKVLLNWPESLMTWDILFLIPTTWVGPVISPIILSVTMISLAVLIVYWEEAQNKKVVLKGWPITLLISGSVIVIVAFTWDYSRYMLQHFSFGQLFSPAFTDEIMIAAYSYIPERFPWGLFWLGELVILLGVFFVNRNRQELV